MSKRTITVILAFLLFSCSPSQILLHSNKEAESVSSLSQSKVILHPSHYSSEKGKNLAVMYESSLNNIFMNIRAKYNHKELEFYPITEAGYHKFTGGIGFFREVIDGADHDNRFLGIAAVTDYFIEKDSYAKLLKKRAAVYIKYIRNLLEIITKESLLLEDKNVSGISIRLSWRHDYRKEVIGFNIRTATDNAFDYVERRISTQLFLSKCTVESFNTYSDPKQIHLSVSSTSKESTLKEVATLNANNLMTIPVGTEVHILDYKDGYFEITNRGDASRLTAYIPRDDFHIAGNLLQMTEIDIKTMKARLESKRLWIKPYVANIRESNSLNSPITDELERGSNVFVQEEVGDWYRVLYNAPYAFNIKKLSDLMPAYDRGWIHKNLTSKDVISTVSVISISPMSYKEKRRNKFVAAHPELNESFKGMILEGKIALGMSKEMVLASMGEPKDINRSVGSWGVREQWVYSHTYVYFRNNILTSWQD